MGVHLQEDKLVVAFDYDPQLIYEIKQIVGRKWNPLFKYWEIPYTTNNLYKLQVLGFDISCVLLEVRNQAREVLQANILLTKYIKEKYSFLYDYQITCAVRGIMQKKLLVTDECGLGKTLETFAIADYFLRQGSVERVCVCCPSSIKWQWQREIKKWFNRDAVIIKGYPEERKFLYEKKPQVFIINYEQILRDFWDIYNLTKWQIILLDEMTYLKNPKAKRTKYVQQLSPSLLYGLTGTPIENKLEDAFTLGNIIQPGWMSKADFYTKYCNFGMQFGFKILLNYKNVDDFMKNFLTIAIRRKRQDVAHFPPKVIYDRLIDLTPYQLEVRAQIEKAIEKDYYNNTGTAIQKFTLLQMVEDSTDLIKLSNAKSLVNIEVTKSESAKLSDLQHIIDELDGGKVVIFTKYRKMTPFIAQQLGKDVIIGSGKTKNKEEIITKFRDEFKFLVATDAFNYGVDMPFVSTIINFDMTWNPARLSQRIDRCYRVTSKEQLKVFNMVANGFEQYIFETMKAKEKLGEVFDLHRALNTYLQKYILQH
jgi:SNF2 family DNA or RNA helicase